LDEVRADPLAGGAPVAANRARARKAGHCVTRVFERAALAPFISLKGKVLYLL